MSYAIMHGWRDGPLVTSVCVTIIVLTFLLGVVGFKGCSTLPPAEGAVDLATLVRNYLFEMRLSDGTRCVVSPRDGVGGLACDWQQTP